VKTRALVLPTLAFVLATSCGGASVADRQGAGHAAVAPVAPPRPDAPETDAKVPIGADDAVRGSRLAPVTMVVFSDFQCPFCAKLETTISKLRTEYGDETLRVVFKHHPLEMHPSARLAAETGQAVYDLAGPEAFWRYHAVVFRDQASMSPESLRAAAALSGLDPAALRALDEGLEGRRWAKKVEADLALGHSLGVEGAPASFVNGIAVSGAQPLATFKDLVEAELAKAKVLADGGVPKDAVYTRLVATNYHPPAPNDDEDAAAAVAAAEARIVHRVPLGTSPIRGGRDALVTIVEFSDFQCKYCKRAESTLQSLLHDYGDKVRLAWRDLPLDMHPRAEPAAELARAARAQKGDATFWKVHDLLFDAQPSFEDGDFERIARDADLDVARAMKAVKAHTYERAIAADADLGDDAGVEGTPSFFVNGRHVEGAQGLDVWKPLVEEEIAKAEALLRAGTPQAALYETLIKGGQELATPEKRTLAAPPLGTPYRGAVNAKIVIQEVGDFQCPFCARAATTIDALLKAYPDQIRVVWRDKPLSFHPNAALAAEAGREAFAQKGSAGFEAMHNLLFANPKALSRSDLEGYAKTIGLDVARFASALDGHVHKAAIDADDKLTTDAGVRGTPAFFVGPYFISGAQPFARFRRVAELAGAKPTARRAKD
jgi:protein-disulfide isomerase